MSTYTEDENSWTIVEKRSKYTRTQHPLALDWEAIGATISDDYAMDEITALDLFYRWVSSIEDQLDENGELPLRWSIWGPEFFERAPLALTPRNHKAQSGDFLTHFTLPVHTETGERINWGRLPVRDGEWVPGGRRTGASDFITTATGWTPGPLQPSVALEFLLECVRAHNLEKDN